ncbi:MAG: RluA family pseudouridine synthase [Bdellovibrionia bacterium]
MSLNLLSPQILFQSDEWLVVSKPAGLRTISGRLPSLSPTDSLETPASISDPSSNQNSTLMSWAEAKTGKKLLIVHRLDIQTSGVVLFAQTASAHRKANLWFQNRQVKKTYMALARGKPQVPFWKITLPIEGASSLTQVQVEEQFSHAFLAQVHPRSGRKHQIRIHLSQSGYPLLGDPRYGGPIEIQGFEPQVTISIPRVALHASSLHLPSGEHFQAPLPSDFLTWIDQLRKDVPHEPT